MQAKMNPLSDLDVYQRLVAMADELQAMRAQGVSLLAGAALETASRSLSGMAQAVYEHSLAGADENSTPQ
jgi:hypothetical protein